jgi:DNA-binding MarR family transcriptional regulator
MPTSPARRASGTSKNGVRAAKTREAPSLEAPSIEASLIATVAPVMRHLVAHARRRRAWSELTYQQYNVLRMIDTMGPQPQAEVARRLMVTAPVVTRLASALVDAGLVDRRPDASDRRAVLLALTATGRRRARAMRRDLLEAAHELLEPVPEERRAALAAALEELQVLLPEHSARR